MTPRFTPSPRQTNCLLAVGFVSLGYALYLRYLVIQNVAVGLACDNDARTWLCMSRAVAGTLGEHQVFGWFALAAAVLNFVRPTIVLFAIALAVSAFGVVLYNAGLAAVAAALLILSFARPASELD